MSVKNNPTKKIEKSTTRALPLHRFFLLASFVIIVVSLATYYKSLNNPLTRWDDDLYVSDNPDITTLSADKAGTIKKTFASFVNGNYHPVTMLSFCVEYAAFKMNAKVFHTTNVVIHILNSLLVLLFIWLLTQKQLVAFMTAMLFAIHPMHVESVAWVSERKDLLYTFFFLSALCTYTIYLHTEKRKTLFYTGTFLLFILSCLSKGMAVSLPLVLFIIDYFKERKFSKTTVFEKVPFLVLSVVFGIVAIKAQATVGAIEDITYYNFFDRILFSCYALMMYLWKLVVPIHNSCFYNYPLKKNGLYPAIIYLSPVVILTTIFLIYRAKKFRKELRFATGFFIATVVLVLQLLPVGAAIIAERYTYIPYIGLFFLIAAGYDHLLNNKKEFKTILITLLVVVFFTLSFLSYKATLLWKDGLTLLDHAVTSEKFDACSLLYKNRAIAYFYIGQYDKAAEDYTRGIERSKKYTSLYCDRGVTYFKMGYYEKAVADLSYTIQHDKKNLNAYHYRGLSYFNLNKYPEAINDMNMAISLSTIYWEHFYYRGLSYYLVEKYPEALADYNYLIEHKNIGTDVYNNRGLILLKLKKYNEALSDFIKALEYNPENSNAYFNMGLAYDELENYDKSIEEYTAAIKYNPNYAYSYSNRAKIYSKIKQYKPALEDALKAKQMGVNVEDGFIELLKKNAKN